MLIAPPPPPVVIIGSQYIQTPSAAAEIEFPMHVSDTMLRYLTVLYARVPAAREPPAPLHSFYNGHVGREARGTECKKGTVPCCC